MSMVIVAICTVAVLALVSWGIGWFKKKPEPEIKPEIKPKPYRVAATEELVSRIIAKLPTYKLYWEYDRSHAGPDAELSRWHFVVPVTTHAEGDENIWLHLWGGQFTSVEFTPEQLSRVEAAAQAEFLNRIARSE